MNGTIFRFFAGFALGAALTIWLDAPVLAVAGFVLAVVAGVALFAERIRNGLHFLEENGPPPPERYEGTD